MNQKQDEIINRILGAILAADGEEFHAAVVDWCALKCKPEEVKKIVDGSKSRAA